MDSYGVAGIAVAGVVATAKIVGGNLVQAAINTLLDLNDSIAGMIANTAVILSVDALQKVVNPLVFQQDADWTLRVASGATVVSLPPESAIWYNRMFGLFLQPNINGIPILAAQEDVDRTVDVSEDPLIVQADADSTTYVTDNAVPHPRVYKVDGYLMSLSPTDIGMTMKPTIQLQTAALDAMAASRRPVLYKTNDLDFVRCLITNFHFHHDPKVTNGVPVTVELHEFVPFETESDLLSVVMAELTSRVVG